MSSELRFSGGGRERVLEVVRRPRARAMRLSVDPVDGAVRLSLPRRAALRPALAWASDKRGWIEGQLAKLPPPRPIEPGMRFLLAGEEVVLDWHAAFPRAVVRDGQVLRLGGPRELLAPRVLRFLRGEALRLLTAETHEIAAREGIKIAHVSVGDPGGRWGSCSGDGRLRYSWRLILAPDFVRRATVAHEVAHRLHMDHSPAFHAAVRRLLGSDPTPARHWLSANGTALHWFGSSG